ncbi:hypothetical protein O0I10_012097 [Lichtheimia ornata]|uniref:Uncharacterized protein n=1 Tax=Lichtheimia ornata TaxID=688661 RepID=A0AAD7URM7_9FUNG|nr:uncharacterized protein O0I10_012097 [Lichtheimia ornata]KAJ8652284.1 hypothetical protein O0I10_012097 [Lichtheimia ornata]
MPYFWLFATVAAFASGPLCPFVLLFACILQLLIAFPVTVASLFCLFMFYVFFRDPLLAVWRCLVDFWVWWSSDLDPRTLKAMRDNDEATKFVMEARAYWKVVDLAGAPLYDVVAIEGPAADEIVSARGDESVFGVAPVFGDVSFAPVVGRSGEDVSALGVASASAFVGVDGVRSSGVDGVRGSVVGDGVSFPAAAATAYDDVEALGAGAADVGHVLDAVPGDDDVAAAFGVGEGDAMDELAFLFLHLSVDDPLDEDTYMAPPFDWRYVEPTDMMELDDDLLSFMSVHLENSPFYQDDDDPIIIDMPSPLIPSRPATPPPSPPPSPTPIHMEVDTTSTSPIVTATAPTTTITNTATTTTTMPTDTPATTTITNTDINPITTHPATAIATSPPPSPPLNSTMSLIFSRIQQLRTRTTPSSNSATSSATATMPTTNATVSTSSRSIVNNNMPPPPSRPRRITLTVTPPTSSSTSTATSTPSSSIVRPDMPPPPPRRPRATATPSSSFRLSSSSSSSSSSATATTSTPRESAQTQQQQQPTTTTTSATPTPPLPSDVLEAQKALGLD